MPYGKSVDAEVINLRATIVLSYGYVVFYCPADQVVQRLDGTVLPFLRQYMANAQVRRCVSNFDKVCVFRAMLWYERPTWRRSI